MNKRAFIIADIDKGFRDLVQSLSPKELKNNKKIPSKLKAVLKLLDKVPVSCLRNVKNDQTAKVPGAPAAI